MSEKPGWVKDLEAQPCTCVTCPECKGSGHVYFDMTGREYHGAHRWDDLDEMESCGFCRGGIVAECDRCAQLNEYDHDDHWA